MNLLFARPWVSDVALAVLAIGSGVAALISNPNGGGDPANRYLFVGVAIAGLALLARRRQPIVVLGVVAVARIVVTWDSGNDVALAFAAMVALFTVAYTGERRVNMAVASGVAVVLMLTVALLEDEAFLPELIGEAALLGLPIALADGARSRADRLQDLIDTEADRRVQAERLRIARDLHDVVAHGLSTIAIQSGVAAHLIDRDTDQAREALEVINQTGKASLEELRAMVGVLRSTDEAPLQPTPTDPNDLTDLTDRAAKAGIALTVSTEGQFPSRASDACVVAVHRIIQEALTNVARHAGAAPTAVAIKHRNDQVEVSITNRAGSASPPTEPSTGVGIIGMTERAESLGGELRTTQLLGGGFEVSATIPYQREPSER